MKLSEYNLSGNHMKSFWYYLTESLKSKSIQWCLCKVNKLCNNVGNFYCSLEWMKCSGEGYMFYNLLILSIMTSKIAQDLLFPLMFLISGVDTTPLWRPRHLVLPVVWLWRNQESSTSCKNSTLILLILVKGS